MSSASLERLAARRIFDAFRAYNRRFRDITRRAARHFERRDWAANRRDAVRRIDLYNQSVVATRNELAALLGEAYDSRECWNRIKECYATLIAGCADAGFYKTFFSSLTRRIFHTVGVDSEVEFLALDVDPALASADSLPTRRYVNRGSLYLLFEELLDDLPFSRLYRDTDGTIRFIVAEVEAYRGEQKRRDPPQAVEIVPALFYRGRRAYAVGRLIGGGWQVPLVIPFAHTDEGVMSDVVILSESDVSMLFGFTRSYFHVDLVSVGSAVRFLRELMPLKPVDELYTVLGRAKQGKTERYRALMRHLQNSTDLFVRAPGARGMVMEVFTLPSFNVVFKVIRDSFGYSKNIRRDEVRDKYELVFRQDRAGRLVDAQEFRRLSFDLPRFEASLKHTLLETCGKNCRIDGDRLLIEHLYIERRLIPLDVYLKDADPDSARHVVIDYGQAVRDLAFGNIFAGDLLLKNFGVTRHGRVIFYDYDEVTFVTDCVFRPLPQSDREEDELAAEPWFFVGAHDVFPEEFAHFLGLGEELGQVFRNYHGELFSHRWWSRLKARLERGEVIEVLPYSPKTRTTKLSATGLYGIRQGG
ncbi:MAG TPA: bifunctional isocitrate dehydrogenase kinase/phosphatase [Woeseiaceae bacterium]|nr:bifunctional isocitrate dehydrogenase kinase/phosphatase [Woeseiaceae bacterium]